MKKRWTDACLFACWLSLAVGPTAADAATSKVEALGYSAGGELFRTAQAACDDFVKRMVPGGRSLPGAKEEQPGSFRCFWKEENGSDNDMAKVDRICPPDAERVGNGCECSPGFVASGGKCGRSDDPDIRSSDTASGDAKIASAVALGTEDPEAGKNLREFAAATKSSHWKDWKKDGLTTLDPPTDRAKFPAYFQDAVVRHAGQIKVHFKLDEVYSSTDFAKLPQTTLPAAKRPWASAMVTKSELLEVLKNRTLLADTTFYLRGQPHKIAYEQIQKNLEAVLVLAAGRN